MRDTPHAYRSWPKFGLLPCEVFSHSAAALCWNMTEAASRLLYIQDWMALSQDEHLVLKSWRLLNQLISEAA